ncbi:hypothetical protein [Paenibacillus mesotrionivorans]|uniref:Uncharacterized protein n=1 Tax=Paenibacillus mesotrionivorans TaxID=3160968 RepID=A0ACC7NUM5_9BACL
MIQALELRIPKKYHHGNQVLQCYETLVSAFYASVDIPYQWLFSDSWSFYYFSPIGLFTNSSPIRYPLQDSIDKILKKPQTTYTNQDLIDLLTIKRGPDRCLIVVIDGWYIPWSASHRKTREPHFIVATDYDAATNQIYLVDLFPTEFVGWFDFNTFNASFISNGKHAFELEKPDEFVPPAGLAASQVEKCVSRIRGTKDGEVPTGIYGIIQFMKDMLELREYGAFYVDSWYKQLKSLTDSRLMFIEFLTFIQQDKRSPHYGMDASELNLLFDKTISAWNTLRNHLMLTKIKTQYDPAKFEDKLRLIIDLEGQCADEMERLVGRMRQLD